MSRRSSRASISDGEFMLECKAAYLSFYDDVKDEIKSREELAQVLQQAGRNPTSRLLAKYWKSSTDELSYDDFVDICRKEPITTTDDLMKAFRKIDINGDGYISLDELYKLMTTKGEKMSRSKVKEMIDEVDENKDGKLDYGEFCQMIMKTTEECKKLSRKVMERKEKKKRLQLESQKKSEGSLGSQTSVRSSASHRSFAERPMSASARSTASAKTGMSNSRRSLLSVDDLPRPSPRTNKSQKVKGEPVSRLHLAEPKNLKEWTHNESKGMFFIDEDEGSLLSHQYTLKLKETTKVWCTIEPTTYGCTANLDGPVDTALFILRNRPDSTGSILAGFTEHRDGRGRYGVRCELSKGTYHLVPFTTGCRLRKRRGEPSKAKSILQERSGKYSLSKSFKKVLEDIFDMSDLDCNGTMSREEFNLYNLRTSGEEEVGDDEWGVVEENLDLKNGEITKDGFIKLNEMEAEDSNGDDDDMWVTLESYGFNKELVMDEACPFKINVYTEDCDDADLQVKGIDPVLEKVEKAVCQSIMEKCEPTKIKGMKDLFMYSYMADSRSSILLDNRSYSSVKIELDCEGTTNCLTSQESFKETFTVKPNSQLIAFHFIPDNEDSSWSMQCKEFILG